MSDGSCEWWERGWRVDTASTTVFEGDCVFCLLPVAPGTPNSIMLACGHLFHWSAAYVCAVLNSPRAFKRDCCGSGC